MSEPQAPSPLIEASPESLEELFSRTDPQNLSDAQIDRIIEAQRAHRAKLAQQAAAKPERVTRKPGPKLDELGSDVDFGG